MNNPDENRILRHVMMETWKKHFSRLSLLGLANVQHNPSRGTAFADVTIENHHFRGLVTQNGPCLWGKTRYGGNCALGVASIQYREAWGWDDHDKSSERFWQVCKHHNQTRIDVSELTDRGRRALAFQFGIPLLDIVINEIDDYVRPEGLAFYVSPAFDALVAWARTHPRRIKTLKPNASLGNWPKAAQTGCVDDASLPARLNWRS